MLNASTYVYFERLELFCGARLCFKGHFSNMAIQNTGRLGTVELRSQYFATEDPRRQILRRDYDTSSDGEDMFDTVGPGDYRSWDRRREVRKDAKNII